MNNQNNLGLKSQLPRIFFEAKSKDSFYKELKSGEEIFSLEKPQQNISFSLKGIIKLSRIDYEREIFIGLLPEKSFVGLSLLLNESELSYRAVALTPVMLISTTVTQFKQKLPEFPQLWTLIFQQALSRSLTAQMIIESRLQRTSEARLVAFLLVLCRDFGIETDKGIRIELKLTHKILADWTHINRPCITKIIGQLQKRQIISVERQQITLYNPNVLRQYFNIPAYSSI